MVNCSLLCNSSLLIVSAKAKISEVFGYFNKVRCEFLASSHTFASAALLAGTPRLQHAKQATSVKHLVN